MQVLQPVWQVQIVVKGVKTISSCFFLRYHDRCSLGISLSLPRSLSGSLGIQWLFIFSPVFAPAPVMRLNLSEFRAVQFELMSLVQQYFNVV